MWRDVTLNSLIRLIFILLKMGMSLTIIINNLTSRLNSLLRMPLLT